MPIGQFKEEILGIADPAGLEEYKAGTAQMSLGKTYGDFAKLVASADAYSMPDIKEFENQALIELSSNPETVSKLAALPTEKQWEALDLKVQEMKNAWNIENRTRSLAAIKGIESGAHYSPDDLTLVKQRAAIQEGLTPWKYEPDHVVRKIAQDIGGERGLQLYKAATLIVNPETLIERYTNQEYPEAKALQKQLIDQLGGYEKAALVPEAERTKLFKNAIDDKIAAAYEGLLAPEEKELWNQYRKDQYGAPRSWRERGVLGVIEKTFTAPAQMVGGAVVGMADALREKTEKENPELADNAFIRAGTALNRFEEAKTNEDVARVRGSADETILPQDSWKSPTLAAASAMGRAATAFAVQGLSLPFRAVGSGLIAAGGGRIAGIDPGVALRTAVDITDVDSRVAALKNAGKNMWAMLDGDPTDKGSVFDYMLKVREGYKATAASQTDDPAKQEELAKELMDRDVASLALQDPYTAQLVSEFALDPSGLAIKPIAKAVGAAARVAGKGVKAVAPETTRVLKEAFSTAPANEAAIMAEAEKLGVNPIEIRNEIAVNQMRADKAGLEVSERLQPPETLKISKGAQEYAFDVREGNMNLSEVPKKYQEEVANAVGDAGVAKWEQTHQQIRETTKAGERYVGGELVPASERIVDPKTYVPHLVSEKKWYNPLKDVEPSAGEYNITDFTAKSELERTGTMKPMKNMYKQIVKAAQVNGESVRYKERIAGLLEGASRRGLLTATKISDAPQTINELAAAYPGTEWIALSHNKVPNAPGMNFQTYTPGETVWDEASTLLGRQEKLQNVGSAIDDYAGALANPQVAKAMHEMGYDVVAEARKAVKAAQEAKIKQLGDDVALIIPKEYGQHIMDVGRLTVRGGRSDAVMEYLGAIARKTRPFMNFWRVSVTLGRGLPYLTRNASSALVLPSVAAGVKVFKPSTAKTNLQIALLSVANNEDRARKVALTLADGTEVSLGQVSDVLDKAGFLGQGLARQGLTESPLGKKIMENTLAGTFIPVWGRGKEVSNATLNSTIENYQKIATFSGLVKSWTPEGIAQALYDTRKFAGHMNNLTRFESSVLREIVPFYAWQKYIIPAMAKGMVNRPQVFAGYIRARGYYDKQNATKYAPYEQRALPKYAQAFGMVSGKQPESPEQGIAVTTFDDPYTMGAWLIPVIQQVRSSKEIPGGDAAKGNLGPVPVMVYEMLGGVDWETGTPIQGTSLEDTAYLWSGVVSSGNEMNTAKKLMNLYTAGHPAVKALLSPLEPMSQDLAAMAYLYRTAGRPDGEIDVKMRYLAARRQPLISAVVDLLRRIEGREDYTMGRELPGFTTSLVPPAEVTMAREQRALSGKAKGIYKQTSKEFFK